MNLLRRHREPEIMDEPDLCPVRHTRALRGLARINWFSNSAGILWPTLRDFSREHPGEPLRILDVATGAGDVPLALWRRARRAGLSWHLTGCDFSPVAITEARRRATEAGAPLTYINHDLARGLPDSPFDVVICSLFLHHLDEEQAVALLRSAAQKARLVLVNDLRRCMLGLVLAQVATRLLTLSSVVRVDGPRSVRAAFTPAEALELAARAGLKGATVRRRWPCRWLLTWRTP